MHYERDLALGAAIARKAGDLALKIRAGDIGLETKADDTPVTIADRACEELIIEELGREWIVDPIDGTKDFIRDTDAWSVLIGLEEDDKVVAGITYFTATGEIFSAARGGGGFWGV